MCPIFCSLVALIAIFLIVAALRPAGFTIARSAVIAAPAAAVFPHVNTLRKWDAWSPWIKLDPNCKNTFEGPAEGVGAVVRWVGNRQVGEGTMTLTESRPSERVLFRLDFLKPMKTTSAAEFTFRPDGANTANTLVTWSMTGKNNLLGKVMHLLMNCDKMVGGQFEKGLASMKAVVESGK